MQEHELAAKSCLSLSRGIDGLKGVMKASRSPLSDLMDSLNGQFDFPSENMTFDSELSGKGKADLLESWLAEVLEK